MCRALAFSHCSVPQGCLLEMSRGCWRWGVQANHRCYEVAGQGRGRGMAGRCYFLSLSCSVMEGSREVKGLEACSEQELGSTAAEMVCEKRRESGLTGE